MLLRYSFPKRIHLSAPLNSVQASAVSRVSGTSARDGLPAKGEEVVL